MAKFLDPRYKLSLYTKITIEEIFGEERRQLVWVAINTCVRDLFEEYRNMYAPSELISETVDDSQCKGGPGGMLKEIISRRMKMINCSSGTSKS